MNVQSRHWLDYDPVALVVLVVGMSAVALLGRFLVSYKGPGAEHLNPRRRQPQ